MNLNDYSLLMILRAKGLSDRKFNELRREIERRNKKKLLDGATEAKSVW